MLNIAVKVIQWSDKWIGVVESKFLNQDIMVFSDNLKPNIKEWLEWFPDDTVYLEHEIELLLRRGISRQGMIRLHEEKRKYMNSLKGVV